MADLVYEKCCSCPHDMFPIAHCDCQCHKDALARSEEEEARDLGISVYDDIERHCPDWYEDEPNGDPADAELARYEETHYVWYDETDRPYIGEIKYPQSPFSENAIPTNGIRLSEAKG